MEQLRITLSKEDILYIIESLDFDEISVPRTLVMNPDFEPVSLIIGSAVVEARRKERERKGLFSNASTWKPNANGDSQSRWQDRRYHALCSLHGLMNNCGQASIDEALTETDGVEHSK